MHDLYLAKRILELVIDFAKKNNLASVKLVKIDLGEMIEHGEDITAENLRFNFKMLAKNTLVQKAKLVIKKKKDFSGFKLKEIEGSSKKKVPK